MYTYKAKILRIVDGDTFDAEVDLGFNTLARLRFRLRGIDTPEVFRPKDKEEYDRGVLASKRALELMPLGSEITINSYKQGAYNRWEADAILSDGRSLAEVLVNEGLSK